MGHKTNQTSKQSVKIVIGDVGKKQKRKKRRVATAGQRRLAGQSMNYGLGQVQNSVSRAMGTRIIRYGDDFGTASASVGDDRRLGDGVARGFQQYTRTFANDNFNPLTTPPPNLGAEQRGDPSAVERAIQRPPNMMPTSTTTPQVKDRFLKEDGGGRTIQDAMFGLKRDGTPDMRTKQGREIAIHRQVENGSTLSFNPPSPQVDLNPHSAPPPPQLLTARALSYLRQTANLRDRISEGGSALGVGALFKQFSDTGSDAGVPAITPSTNALGGNRSDRGSDA